MFIKFDKMHRLRFKFHFLREGGKSSKTIQQSWKSEQNHRKVLWVFIKSFFWIRLLAVCIELKNIVQFFWCKLKKKNNFIIQVFLFLSLFFGFHVTLNLGAVRKKNILAKYQPKVSIVSSCFTTSMLPLAMKYKRLTSSPCFMM